MKGNTMNQNHAMSHSSSLRRLAAVLCGSLLLLGCTRSIVVPEPTAPGGVEPVQTRISDPVIAADLAFIESLRTRMQRLNEEGRPIDDYHLCKAQAWTDLASGRRAA